MIDVDGLARVSPLWAKALQEVGMERYVEMGGKYLDIGKWNYCIVGEAYGFRAQDGLNLSPTMYDGCRVCFDFANTFDNLFLEDDPLGMKESIVRFMQHVEKEHPHLIKVSQT